MAAMLAGLRDAAMSAVFHGAGKRINACPMRSVAPGAMPSASANPGGAKTMIVEPCSNHPISWPFASGTLHEVSLAPRWRSVRFTSRK